MIKLIWTVAFLNGFQPVAQEVPDIETFKTKEECQSYGDAHRGRMEDWARGNLRVHFSFPMSAVYRCEAEERKA